MVFMLYLEWADGIFVLTSSGWDRTSHQFVSREAGRATGGGAEGGAAQPAAGGPATRKAQRHTDRPGRPSHRRSSPGAQEALPRTSGTARHVLAVLKWFTLLRTAAIRLFYVLQIRNKLNQEQNSKLQQQKELLNKRNMEVTLMDKRISELRERLFKKKAEARQKENLPVRLGPLNPSLTFCHINPQASRTFSLSLLFFVPSQEPL